MLPLPLVVVYPMNWYVIKGLGPGFDGMFVNGVLNGYYVAVHRLVNRNVMFGDRDLSFSFPESSFMLSPQYLQPISDPILREYDTKNPWGEFVCEGSMKKGDLVVSFAEYKNSFQFTVQEKIEGSPTKTIYSENFDLSKISVEELMEQIDRYSPKDLDDLIFKMKELKNRG